MHYLAFLMIIEKDLINNTNIKNIKCSMTFVNFKLSLEAGIKEKKIV